MQRTEDQKYTCTLGHPFVRERFHRVAVIDVTVITPPAYLRGECWGEHESEKQVVVKDLVRLR
jgi:hypothetical protein